MHYNKRPRIFSWNDSQGGLNVKPGNKNISIHNLLEDLLNEWLLGVSMKRKFILFYLDWFQRNMKYLELLFEV